MRNMLRIQRLSKSIPGGPKILKDITLDAYEGDFIAVKGASGSGKSTLLKCIALQEKWTSGKYIFNGKNIFEEGFRAKMKLRQEVAYLEEKPFLFPERTALKNVIIGAVGQTPAWRRWSGIMRSDDYMGAMDVLEKRGLIDKAKMKAKNLSGGEQQRVAIARALVHGAKVIVADEPVAGLDPHAAEAVLAELKGLCKEQGIIVIAVLHQGDWAERYADRIIGLNGGELVVDVYGRRLTEREKNLI